MRVTFLAVVGGVLVAGPVAAQCEPDGEVKFVCGPVSPEDLVERLQGWLLQPAFLTQLAPLVLERIKRLFVEQQ